MVVKDSVHPDAGKDSGREKHVNLLGIFFIISGCMGLMAGVVAVLLMLGVAFLGRIEAHEPGLVLVSGAVSTILTLVVLLVSVPQIVAGIGLLKFKPWASVMSHV